jgi:hypothetical protein
VPIQADAKIGSNPYADNLSTSTSASPAATPRIAA